MLRAPRECWGKRERGVWRASPPTGSPTHLALQHRDGGRLGGRQRQRVVHLGSQWGGRWGREGKGGLRCSQLMGKGPGATTVPAESLRAAAPPLRSPPPHPVKLDSIREDEVALAPLRSPPPHPVELDGIGEDEVALAPFALGCHCGSTASCCAAPSRAGLASLAGLQHLLHTAEGGRVCSGEGRSQPQRSSRSPHTQRRRAPFPPSPLDSRGPCT